MSSARKDGGFAFPLSFESENYVQEGMSLRDWFAGQALASIPMRSWEHLGKDAIIEAWAKCAYAVADAMLAERDKDSQP